MTVQNLRLDNRTEGLRHLCGSRPTGSVLTVRSPSSIEGWHRTATNLPKLAGRGEERLWLLDSGMELASVLATHEEGIAREEIETWLASFE